MRNRVVTLSRVIGLIILGILLWMLDRREMVTVVKRADITLVLVALLLHVPHISLKALRWRCLLKSQGIEYGVWNAVVWAQHEEGKECQEGDGGLLPRGRGEFFPS